MAQNGDELKQPHFAVFPFMAQGHMIPMLDIARMLAARRARVTVLLTPHNAARVKPVLDRTSASGLSFRVAYYQFPCTQAGLPQGCENVDMLPSADDVLKFFDAAAMVKDQVEALLQEIRPDCLIADVCFPWTADVALKLHLPRIVFHGTSCFALTLWFMLESPDALGAPASDTEYFVVPNFPHRIDITMAQLRGTPGSTPPSVAMIHKQMKEGTYRAVGTVFNTFEELEPDYVKEYAKLMGNNRLWCIGPVSLCNEDELDKAERGHSASIDKHQCLKWLDSHEPGSVLYVCLGSSTNLCTSQLIELGVALEASNRIFVWVIRVAKDELRMWMDNQGFEDKVRGRGLLIHGWAPQVLILSHASVGGFLTHCGWNSMLEGITAGLPMITWPVYAEQFSNEKLLVNVVKTGVRVGVEMPDWYGQESEGGVQVRSGEIKLAIDEVMDGGEEGGARRARARQLGKKARRPVDVGGSSYMNMSRLIEDVQQGKLEEQYNLHT